MKKYGRIMLGLFLIAGFALSAGTTTAQTTPEVITINSDPTALAFVETEIELEKGVEYNITFVNPSTINGHNLIIDVDDDVSSSNLADYEGGDDILVGLENDNPNGTDGTWSALWTTPNADTVVTFYCGYTGHYDSGMKGEFIIGEGEDSPGFGIFFALAAMFIIATAVPRLRRQ